MLTTNLLMISKSIPSSFGEDMTKFPDTYIPFDTIVFKETGVIFVDGSLINC